VEGGNILARRKTGYDAACYYGGKLMGRCTVADSDAYVALMEQCGGNAARVLQEYAYFSAELKEVLEKVAGIQAAQNRGTRPGASLYAEPEQSPWGDVQHCDTLCPGVFLVSTASHGGIMVSKDMAPMLSTAARKCGFKQNGYLCFEEDSQEDIVFRELLDKKLWAIPDRIKDKAAYEETINKSIREYNPEYWRARQSGLDRVQARQTVSAPAHAAER